MASLNQHLSKPHPAHPTFSHVTLMDDQTELRHFGPEHRRGPGSVLCSPWSWLSLQGGGAASGMTTG